MSSMTNQPGRAEATDPGAVAAPAVALHPVVVAVVLDDHPGAGDAEVHSSEEHRGVVDLDVRLDPLDPGEDESDPDEALGSRLCSSVEETQRLSDPAEASPGAVALHRVVERLRGADPPVQEMVADGDEVRQFEDDAEVAPGARRRRQPPERVGQHLDGGVEGEGPSGDAGGVRGAQRGGDGDVDLAPSLPPELERGSPEQRGRRAADESLFPEPIQER
ncbi:hypothetical protein Q0F99_03145 [Rathayibacter oskolensis]|uniref:hypothetical protein n=1 Tax=Rathayibacter oskolensis TaxID=1891671 RepID=UPI00265DB2B7|nr:hypothetical protein [Rathayibacter oskolensis]WKK72072.1 hypothetical protein Q0F99_03145 [Rathayibacter oskolensis]